MKKVTLVSKGRCDWQLILADGSTPAAQFAGRELRKYVQQMSAGAIRPVARDEGKPTVVIGLRKSLDAKDRRLLPRAAKGHDGYAIALCPAAKSTPARIVIAGDNGRGALYGVYDLLERLGCRWFYPAEDPFDPEVVPHKPTLDLASGAWAVASPMKVRICNGAEWFFEIDAEKASQQLDWAMKNRYNIMGWQSHSKTPLLAQYEQLRDWGLLAELEKREMTLHGPAHSFDHFLRAEDHMKKHPEWFGLRDGKRVPQNYAGAQFCWSNAEARKEFVKNSMEFIRHAKAISHYCSVPFDGGLACACDTCQRIGASNLSMTLTAELIDALAKVRPDAVFETTGGYAPTGDPPTGMKFHPRLRSIWAHWGRYHGEGYDDPTYGRIDNLEAWRKVCRGGLNIVQYYTDNFAEPWILPPFTVAMLSDRRYFVKKRIDSYYMLFWPKDYWWNHSLNGYLAGRVLYDFNLDPYAVLKDYALHYYGPKAGPLIGKYYEEWARNPDLAYRVKDDALPVHRDMLAHQRKDFIDPAVRAAKRDPLLSYRVGKVEKLHRLAEKSAEMYRLRDEIRLKRAAGNFPRAASLLAKAGVYTDALLDYFYEIADLNQGLMDRNEVPSFIRLKVKGWIDEEAAKIESKDGAVPKGIMDQLTETQMLPAAVTG